jgi:hypothetical protein
MTIREKRKIIIDNQDAHFLDYSLYEKKYIEKGKVSTKEFIENIQGNNFLLPEGTRFFKKYSSHVNMFVIERHPETRTIFIEFGPSYRWRQFKNWCTENNVKDGIDYFKEKFDNKFTFGLYNFQVNIPFIIYIIMTDIGMNWYQDFRVFIRPNKLKSLSSYLYNMPVSNCTGTGRICLGWDTTEIMNASHRKDITIYLETIIKSFWSIPFNSEYSTSIKKYSKSIYSNLFIWEYLSKTNPLQLMTIPLQKYAKLEDVILSVLSSQSGTIGDRVPMVRKIKFFFPEFKEQGIPYRY